MHPGERRSELAVQLPHVPAPRAQAALARFRVDESLLKLELDPAREAVDPGVAETASRKETGDEIDDGDSASSEGIGLVENAERAHGLASRMGYGS